ncbi:MAG: substrate-binding domain-containing protein, partial [Candidatus Atribacteria bacterium]|nr:substrate-binding domain-containing protein [Candidatus Atribacteria bacterium]
SSFFDPSLTTIHYPMRELGIQSFELFHRMVNRKKKVLEHLILETNLIVRKSTNPDFPLGPDIVDNDNDQCPPISQP